MMLYSNTKVNVRSSGGDTDFFGTVASVLPYLFTIYYILRKFIYLIKENVFTLKKARSRRYLAETITDADYDNDIVLSANTPTQAENLLHSLEQVVGDISLDVNADKTEHMGFNQETDISTLNGGSLKLVDKFTYLESSVSSTESDINMRLAKE